LIGYKCIILVNVDQSVQKIHLVYYMYGTECVFFIMM